MCIDSLSPEVRSELAIARRPHVARGRQRPAGVVAVGRARASRTVCGPEVKEEVAKALASVEDASDERKLAVEKEL